jgi:hypothetical protein
MGAVNPPPPVESRASAAPERRWRRFLVSRWFPIVVGVWVVIFGVSGWIGIAHTTVTDREQTTVAAARPYVDEAVARLATAAASGGNAVVAVSAFEKVGTCRVTVFRQGQRFERDLVAVVAPGSERALMDGVAATLPGNYHAVVRTVDPPRLTADAGFFVAVTGTVVAPGEVRFVADTGDCRTPGDVTTADQAVPTSDPVRDVLDRLKLATPSISTAAVSCVDGGAVGSVQVRADAWKGDLTQALAGLPDATVLVDAPRLYAYRTGDAQVAVRAHDDATIITVTTVCG